MEHRPATDADIRFNDPPDRGPDLPLDSPLASLPRQPQWRWCRKCNGLWFGGGSPSGGRCPAGGSHTSAGSGDYAISYGFATSGGQNGWRFCSHCHGLWFDGGRGHGRCPERFPFGPRHSGIGSFFYVLAFDPKAPGQHGWRWCRQCEGLWFGGAGNTGRCPTPFGTPSTTGHDLNDSADYALRIS